MSAKVMCRLRCAIAVFVLALFASHSSVSAITCSQAVAKLSPCIGYLTGKSNGVTVPCCSGVDSLNKMAKTSPDRRSLCECFKKVGPAIGVKQDRAEALPKLCHINVNVPIRYDTDCSKLEFMDNGGSMHEEKFMLHN